MTYEQAVAALPDGDQIHVTVNSIPGVLLGADWDRAAVLDLLAKHEPQRAGPMATASNHGIVVLEGDRRLFVATRPGAFARQDT